MGNGSEPKWLQRRRIERSTIVLLGPCGAKGHDVTDLDGFAKRLLYFRASNG